MKSRISILSTLAFSFIAACDPSLSLAPARRARPTVGNATAPRAQRPVMVEGALSGACDPNVFICIDEETLEYCGRSGTAPASCDAVCRSAGYPASNGCGYEPSLDGDACFCDTVTSAPGPACAAGWSCSGDTLSYCEAGVLESWSCDAVCRDAGFDLAVACDWDASLGDESCFCDDVSGASGCAAGDETCGDGTCVDATFICDGYDDCASGADEYGCSQCNFEGGLCNGWNHVDVCDPYGQIATYDCEVVCQDSGYDLSEGCQYDTGSGGDSCFCQDVPRCQPGELTCGDGSCLPDAYVCDGYTDCLDAEDEIACARECVPGEVYCSGDYTIQTCDDLGLWVDWDCDAVCQDAGYRYAESCGYDSFASGDACFCTD